MNPEIIALLVMALSTISSDSMLQTPKSMEELKTIMDSQQAAHYTVPREKNIIKDPQMIRPIIKAKSAIVVDLETGSILHKKNAFERLPIASLTKMMTALIIAEEVKDFDIFVKVPHAATQVGGSSMHLKEGEILTIRDLMKGLLIPSGNDAAITLAMHSSGSVEAFVEKMNNRAQELGLIDTHFANPMGFDNENNYSTSYELTILAKEALKHIIIKETVSKPYAYVSSISGKFEHRMFSTNKLLDTYLKIRGIKTGTTEGAGASLVTLAEFADHPIIAVTLNSPDRFQESKVLLDWAYRSYTWKEKTKH